MAAQHPEPPSSRVCISGLPAETSAGLVQRMHRVMRHLDKVEGTEDLPQNLDDVSYIFFFLFLLLALCLSFLPSFHPLVNCLPSFVKSRFHSLLNSDLAPLSIAEKGGNESRSCRFSRACLQTFISPRLHQ